MRRLVLTMMLSVVMGGTARALGPQPPDQVDVFYKPPAAPNVVLLLDLSKSMGKRSGAAYCPWFQNDSTVTSALNGGSPISNDRMRRREFQMKASLVGCQSPNDGIVDRWHGEVNFEARYFNGSTGILAPFGTSKSSLESAIVGSSRSNGTRMARGLAAALVDLQNEFDPAEQCKPNAVVLMSDGRPTGGPPSLFEYGATDGASCSAMSAYSTNKVWCGAAYMGGTMPSPSHGCSPFLSSPTQTVMCTLGATEEVLAPVHAIAFDTNGSAVNRMQRTAHLGGGRFFFADSVLALDEAFEQTIRATFSVDQESFQTGTVELEGPYVYNSTFPTMFKPGGTRGDLWFGNLKKYCILPPQNPDGSFQSGSDCMFVRDSGNPDLLVANPHPEDQWTGNTDAEADKGGAGELLTSRVGSDLSYPRNLAVWKSSASKLVDLSKSDLGADDLWIHGRERHFAINRLHGYTHDAFSSGSPKAGASWALPETMNGQPALLRFDSGPSYLLYAANDGMLHVFDATNGEEVSALMPKHVLSPAWSPVTNFSVRDLFDGLNTDRRHVFLLDGSPRLFHVDDDGDGSIDSSETAKVVFGLGRAGAGYYMFDATKLASGTFDVSADEPEIFALVRTPGSPFEDLADTWAAPWLGLMKLGGVVRNVAIFGSGHEREYDHPTAPAAAAVPGQWVVDPPVGSPPHAVSCPSLIGTSSVATPGSMDCVQNSPAYGPLDTSPMRIRAGPIRVPDGVAYRVRFSDVNMDPNDYLRLLDSKGELVQTMTATVGSLTSDWIYAPSISVEFETDGNPTSHTGFVMATFEYRTVVQEPPRRRSPSLFVVDLDRWNGSSPVAWSDPTPSGLTAAVRLRFTADCGSHGANCFDKNDFSDLRYMRCPISAEPSVLTVQNRVERIYFGDECGQLWRVKEAATGWEIARIFNANGDFLGTSWPDSGSHPDVREIRKIMTPLDLVRSRCTGKPAIGIYFGTGNLQRPTADDDPLGRRDVLGVIWDDDSLSSSTDLTDLVDVTTTDSVDPSGFTSEKGWYIRLGSDERVLRRGLVFGQTAYFKTYEPATASGACSNAIGTNALYAMDSCTAEAIEDPDSNGYATYSERRAESYAGQIGSAPNLVITRDTAVVLSERGSVVREPLDPNRGQLPFRRARMLHWRSVP